MKKVYQRRHPTSSFRKIRYHEELYIMADHYITTVHTTTNRMSDHSMYTPTTTGTTTTTPSATTDTMMMIRSYVTYFQSQLDVFRNLINALQSEFVPPQPPPSAILLTTTTTKNTHFHASDTSGTSTGTSYHPFCSTATTTISSFSLCSSCYDTCITYSIKKWIQMGLFEDRLGLEPAFLTSRGQSLSKEMEQLANWRKHKPDWYHPTTNDRGSNSTNPSSPYGNSTMYDHVHRPPHTNTTTATATEKKLSGLQVFHLTLNMLAAFLYCMNYYVRIVSMFIFGCFFLSLCESL
jgi:hypothetical protein